MAEEGLSSYSKREIRQLAKVLGAMGDDAVAEARTTSSSLANYALDKIKQAAYGRQVSAAAVQRVADGAKISKTSKSGQISIGFAGQRFSGGATTQMLWGGLEFGTKNPSLRQFPSWSGRYGAGSRGWFIYPTLRSIQPDIVKAWTEAMNKVIKGWAN